MPEAEGDYFWGVLDRRPEAEGDYFWGVLDRTPEAEGDYFWGVLDHTPGGVASQGLVVVYGVVEHGDSPESGLAWGCSHRWSSMGCLDRTNDRKGDRLWGG